MFDIRFFLPVVVILFLLLAFTAPRWTKWLAKFVNRAKGSLDEAGKNLEDIGKKKEK